MNNWLLIICITPSVFKNKKRCLCVNRSISLNKSIHSKCKNQRVVELIYDRWKLASCLFIMRLAFLINKQLLKFFTLRSFKFNIFNLTQNSIYCQLYFRNFKIVIQNKDSKNSPLVFLSSWFLHVNAFIRFYCLIATL